MSADRGRRPTKVVHIPRPLMAAARRATGASEDVGDSALVTALVAFMVALETPAPGGFGACLPD